MISYSAGDLFARNDFDRDDEIELLLHARDGLNSFASQKRSLSSNVKRRPQIQERALDQDFLDYLLVRRDEEEGDGGVNLETRVPTVTNMDVKMWDLGYMDLKTGDSKLYQMSKPGGENAKGQKATGTMRIKTTNLSTCVALAIAGREGALLGHFPPDFCNYLAGTKLTEPSWQAKAGKMKEKLSKTLATYKTQLSGGSVVIVLGYQNSGNVAAEQLNAMLHAAGITPAANVVRSQFDTTVEARSAIVAKLPAGTAHIWVDGHML